MTWTWMACVVAAAAAGSFAQDAPHEENQFVMTARLTGDKLTGEQIPVVFVWPREGAPDDVDVHTTFDPETRQLRSVMKPTKPDGPARIQLAISGRDDLGLVLAFVESLRGKLDLGDVALGTTAKPLVAGRAVAADGIPEYGVSVVVSFWPSRGHSYRLPGFAGISDETGAFRIPGVVRGGPDLKLELGATDGWTSEKPVQFAAGQTDVRIVVSRTSGVHGTVVAPDDLPIEDLVVVLNGPPGGVAAAAVEGGRRSMRRGDVFEFPASRAFNVNGLRPGKYDVRLKFAESSRWLARLADVTIDDTGQDLAPLVVKDPIAHAKVQVLAHDGSPAAAAELWARGEGDRGKFRRIALGADASADIAFVGEGVTLAARADGTDFVRIAEKARESHIVLPAPASTRVTIELPESGRSTAPGVSGSVMLNWRGDATLSAEAAEAAFDETDPRARAEFFAPIPASGPATAEVPVAGWYRVGLRKQAGLNSSSTFGGDLVRVERGHPAKVAVSLSLADLNDPVR